MAGPLTLAQIASRLGGRVAGKADVLIRQVGSLEGAGSGQITFLSDPRHKAKLASTRASAVVVGSAGESLTRLPRIVCDRPYAYFARVSQLFNPAFTQAVGVHPGAVVAQSARIGRGVSIGAGCVVGEGVTIGDDSCLYPNVTVYTGCTVGARAILHSGAVIGADGFGIAPEDGRWVKFPQIGAVRIGDDVEIGANTTVDRGAIEDTVIGDGVKLDNQIQVGHNVRIGEPTAIAGCVGIAGSAEIGKRCTIGGAAVILGHLRLADDVHVSAGTLISRSILKPGTYTGVYPFDEHGAWLRNAAQLRQLGKRKTKKTGKRKKHG